MVINLSRYRLERADATGRTWWVGNWRPRRTRINMMRYRAFFNGHDVTLSTFYVDSRRGIIRMFKRNEEGRHYVDPATGEAAWEEKRGNVKLIRKREAA